MSNLSFTRHPLRFACATHVFKSPTRVKFRIRIPSAAWRLACGLVLAGAIPLATAPVLCAAANAPSVMDPKQVEDGIKKFFAGRSPKEEAVRLKVLAKSRPLSPLELLTLARAEFADQSFAESLAIATTLTGSFASDPNEAIHVHILIAENLGALGKFTQAADAASEAQKLFPESTTLAALRVMYYTKADNLVDRVIAEDHLRKINPQFQQKPVVFGIDDAVIIAGMAFAAYVAIVVYAPRDNVEAVNKMVLSALPLLFEKSDALFKR